MNLDLTGKRAIVCGSTQGIGKATAIELAALGAEIVLIARNEDELKKTISVLPGKAKHQYVVADFNQPEHLKINIEAFLQKNGPAHILVNNTGGPPGGPITEAKEEEFIKAFTAHLICNQILAQAVFPGMKSSGYGRIVNIISTSVKQPLQGLGVSNTVRAAVGNWSKTWANEVAQFGITVNNVLPGATATARLASIISTKAAKTGISIDDASTHMMNEVPMKRFAKPEEIAAAVAFLCSPSAAYISGINLPVDGGRTSSL